MSSEKQAEAGEKAHLVHGHPPSYSQQVPTVVVQPVIMQQGQLSEGMPPDYLALTVFTLLCCFMPLSVFALIKSLEVRSSYQNGFYQDSMSASRTALTFNKLSIVVGIVIWVVIALAQLSWIIPIAVFIQVND